jgi:hypothetical protein
MACLEGQDSRATSAECALNASGTQLGSCEVCPKLNRVALCTCRRCLQAARECSVHVQKVVQRRAGVQLAIAEWGSRLNGSTLCRCRLRSRALESTLCSWSGANPERFGQTREPSKMGNPAEATTEVLVFERCVDSTHARSSLGAGNPNSVSKTCSTLGRALAVSERRRPGRPRKPGFASEKCRKHSRRVGNAAWQLHGVSCTRPGANPERSGLGGRERRISQTATMLLIAIPLRLCDERQRSTQQRESSSGIGAEANERQPAPARMRWMTQSKVSKGHASARQSKGLAAVARSVFESKRR